MTTSLARNWQLVRHTETALRSGSESLGNVPALLRTLLEEEAWREFTLPNGSVVTHERFPDFVSAQPPRGLGTDMRLVERVIGTSDPDLLLLVRTAKAGRPGRPKAGEIKGDSPSISDDSTSKIADRLAREAPDKYEAVKSGELSINGAAVLAGIKPRRISVRLDDPVSIARSLHRNLPAEDFADLATEVQQLLLVHRDDDP